MTFARPIALLTAVALAGCATHGAQYVPVVDLQDKNETLYSIDLKQCQQYATKRMGGAEGALAGALVGALLGAALAPPGYGKQVAGYTMQAGAVAGGVHANDTQETIVKRCLAGRGYSVLD